MPFYLYVGVSHHLEFCSPAVARAVMVCHIFCCSLFHVGIAVFIQSFRSFYFSPFLHSHRYHQPRARAVFRSFIPFHFAPFHFQGLCLSHPAYPCGCSIVPFHSTKLHHPAHIPFSFITLHYSTFVLFIQPLLFPPHRSGKKIRQTSCRQHPSTAPCAICVRGTHSTRSGSHTTHRLNTSFRFSSLAFQPCYPRWLKAVFTKKIRFKPASPTPTPDHPPLI